LRSGVDLVTIVAPERAANIIASLSADLITYPLKGDYLGKEHLSKLMEFSKNKTAVVIGGGLCREKNTLLAVKEFLKRIEIPAVIDADAIYALDRSLLKKNFVITPHSREFYAMTGIEPEASLEKRIQSVKRFNCKSTILLKGFVDIISDGAAIALNRAGNPYMTKGGTGDTLAGICGSLLAQGIECFDAACAAAFINGRAGDIAAKDKKQGLLATDLIEKIPMVFR
jgi:NAD(P)H-hydrate epimerase